MSSEAELMERVASLESEVDRITAERNELREYVESVYDSMRRLEQSRGLYGVWGGPSAPRWEIP